tara:strand:- start:356 stop:649 length:294 start_codon:yes stop_codon:yes gene_type:complete
MKASIEQLEEMEKRIFRQQCDLAIQKAMVKHFLKNKRAEQLTLTDVVKTLKDKYTPTFKEWKQDNYNHWGNDLFVKKQDGLRNIEQLQKIYKKEYNL